MRVFGYDIKLSRSTPKREKHNKVIDFFAPRFSMFDFAKSEILDCQKMISSRLSNVEWHSKIEFMATKSIFGFISSNYLQYVRRMFFDGFVIVNTQTLEFVDTTGRRAIKTLDGKMVIELCDDEVLQVSETFEATGYSDFDFLRDKVRFLNVVNSSDMNLIENYGAMGIVSPESDNSVAGAEFSTDDIKELQDRYSKSYGITLGKWSLMFVPRPARYSKIDLPIAQLQLSDKRLYLLKAICAAFGIPKELSVYFENAKYANRNEAELEFYSTTISTWAKAALRLSESIYQNIKNRETFLMPNEFWFDFTGVFALQEAQMTEKERAREEMAFWRDVVATMPEHAETANLRINDLIESL